MNAVGGAIVLASIVMLGVFAFIYAHGRTDPLEGHRRALVKLAKIAVTIVITYVALSLLRLSSQFESFAK